MGYPKTGTSMMMNYFNWNDELKMISGEDREQGERENLGEFYIHHEDDMDLFFC